ncbi:MAG: GPW/gp25 family protein [Bacteroidetes bacterium]|nr:GPW/gp25 family protein [Bacteroidota bacterium]
MDKKLDKRQNHFLGSGWAFPVTFSAGNSLLQVNQYENNINDNIDIILQTHLGDRIMEPSFGAGLHQFMFKKMNATLKGRIVDTVKTTLLLNEPRIKVKEVTVVFTDVQNGIVSVTIAYIFNQTNTRYNYVFPFNIKEKTGS